jgi:hypothetical protein
MIGIVPSHPFRKKQRKGWGTQFHNFRAGSVKAFEAVLEIWQALRKSFFLISIAGFVT